MNIFKLWFKSKFKEDEEIDKMLDDSLVKFVPDSLEPSVIGTFNGKYIPKRIYEKMTEDEINEILDREFVETIPDECDGELEPLSSFKHMSKHDWYRSHRND